MTGTAISKRTPLNDNRGAIMVIGIFFACMMIGWMWTVVGLGDAMIWRDRSQEASDAISYSSAAIQAQGMNLISFVNVLMLIMASVYMLLSFVYNILDFLHILFGSSKDAKKIGCVSLPSSCGARKDEMDVLSELPYMEWLQPVADIWCDAADVVSYLHDGNTNGAPSTFSVGGLLDKFETLMVDTMPAMSTFEDFVSYSFPWAGELVGVYTGTQYKDWGKDRWGVALSGTLIPATTTPGQGGSGLGTVHRYKSCADEECKTPLNCDAQNPGNCANFNGGDKREGLPVAIPDSGFTALCDYAGSKIASEAQAAVTKLAGGIIGWIVGKIMGGVGGAVTDAFCKHDSTGLFSGIDDDVAYGAQGITLILMGGMNNKETCPKNNWGQDGGGKGDLGCGGPGTCNAVYQIKYKNQNFWEDPVYAGGPHLVVEYASNGNDWMQVWGAVWGGNRVEQSEKLVAVAGMQSNSSGTWKNIVPQNSDTSFSLYLSQAEFYFDCEDKWEADECNKDGNASYNMNWRARLRRMHGLSWGSDLFGFMWNGNLGSTFDDKAKEVIKGAMSSVFTNKLVGTLATTALNGGFKALKNYTGSAIGGLFNPASAVPDFIH
jgi:hypothetical protein